MSWYDDIVPHNRDPYGPAFFKFTELDHGWSCVLFGHVLALLFEPESVIEFGCGTGMTLVALRDLGCEVVGVDGSAACIPFVERHDPVVAESILVHDLAEPFPLDIAGRFDLAISIETLEHLPESGADVAVATLCSAAPRLVVSACPPTGGNSLHLNEQPFDYWIAKFAAAGFALHERETADVRRIMRAFYDLEGRVVPAWYFSSYIGVFRGAPSPVAEMPPASTP